MSEPLYYKTEDMPPPYTVDVWVVWSGREFKARRGCDPKTKRDVWAEVKSTGLQVIKSIDDQFAPWLWRPQFPEKWVGQLPEPVTRSKSGIMKAETMRFQAVDDATSEELARDMERDREAARVAGVSSNFHVKQPLPWWYIVNNIKHEGLGDVTKRNCEGRLMRALTFCGAKNGFGIALIPTAKAMAELAKAMEIALAAGVNLDSDDESSLRLRALPVDIEDFPTAMAWYCQLSPPEFWKEKRKAWALNRPQKVLLARSLASPPSYSDIAHEYNIGTGDEAKKMYDRAISQCLAAANGKRVHDVPVVDQVAALQERNRAYRRTA